LRIIYLGLRVVPYLWKDKKVFLDPKRYLGEFPSPSPYLPPLTIVYSQKKISILDLHVSNYSFVLQIIVYKLILSQTLLISRLIYELPESFENRRVKKSCKIVTIEIENATI
jgi:hypothetical protein